MKHGSLFSGIGGFDLAAEWCGWENVFHCEWNPFGQKVLKHHFPNSISYNDITKTDFSIHRGNIDIITGGFPCQPYSTAGLRKGKADERHLFPEMLRAIKEIQPTWVIGENVRGLVSWGGGMVFHEVCDDLEREGYEVQPFIIPAASVNAPHKRERIWFIAHSNNKRKCAGFGQIQGKNGEIPKWDNNAEFSDTNFKPHATKTHREMLEHRNGYREDGRNNQKIRTKSFNGPRKWETFPTKPAICGGNDGLSRELDGITFPKWRNESIKAYGNAIVPQVAYEIFKIIIKFNQLNQQIK
jgi:DNA (cytosine-5)-methyltransferase 1